MRQLLLVIALLASPSAATAEAPDRTALPLGDQRTTSSPRAGYVETCGAFDPNGGGAFRDGPWIDEAAGTWDMTAKISVAGSVRRGAEVAVREGPAATLIRGNGLPAFSGTWPVSADDPAYQYDRNPNSVRSYTLKVRLPAKPKAAARPTCVGGTIGVARDGIPIYSAFDATGRDAPAHEIQDRFGGHPQRSGQYHYHSLPATWKDRGPKAGPSSLFGYALDGFGIYGPRDERGRTLSTADLDACHGRTSRVKWRGRYRRIYHYVATDDFPYLVGCFRGRPITSATGLGIGGPG